MKITKEQAEKNIQKFLPLLSEREREYWDMIYPNSGVLNLIGKPGLFKTAILRSIALKLNFLYFDHRLTTMDETDLGCYPKTKNRGDYEVIYYPLPEWALDANIALENGYNGAFVAWEELNRASGALRNAALKILLEKEVGVKFKFENHVYMCATGNLGLEDNTDVEEFDTALASRIITFEHDPGLEEWVKNYAKENIHKDILYFLEYNPAFYYPVFSSDASRTFTNPRTWTFLSDFIIKTFGKDSTYADYHKRLEKYGSSYINPADMLEFLKFMNNYYKVSYQDILQDKNSILTEENFKNLDRDISLRLINDLRVMNVKLFNQREVNNLIKFLSLVEPDSRVTFLFEMSCNFKNGYKQEDFLESADNNLNKILNSFPVEKRIIYEKVVNSVS